tara:strand:+ start:288 stop:575 length:288 start_codon:yes stop_codon:yes gene_type:complete
MMYMLRFQKAGPYHWGEINVVTGEISAVHALYNTLTADASAPSSPWARRVVAEVTALGAAGRSAPVYTYGTFKNPGDEVDLYIPLEGSDALCKSS